MPGRLAPEGARLAAAVPGAVLKPTRLAPEGAVVKAGGVAYEAPNVCPKPTKTGEQCKGHPTRTGLCVGHERQERKANAS